MGHDPAGRPLSWLLWPRVRPYVVPACAASFALNLAAAMPAVHVLQVFDRVLASRSIETLVMLTVLASGALVLAFCMDRVRAALLARAAHVVDETLSAPALQAALADAARAQGGAPTAALHDIARLRGFLAGPAIHALFDAPWLPVYLLLIYALHPVLGLAATVAAAGLFALGALAERLVGVRAQEASAAGRVAGRQAELMLGNAEVLVGGGLPHAMRRWRQLHAQALQCRQRLVDRSSTLAAGGRLLRQSVQVAMPALGAWLVIGGDASPGIMVAATVLVARALQPVEHLIAGWKSVLDARAAWRRLAQHVVDAPGRGAVPLPAARGELALEGVTCCLGPGSGPILRGISLRLAAGQCLGVLGPSGAGKTMLVRLMLGLHRPTLGSVRLDGAELTAWAPEQFAGAVGYLPQHAELFDGTVAQNIARLADLDADEAARCQVVRAALRAGAHEMIVRLPQGYDTPVGEGGRALSGGQRQRIALARALYGDPRLVVLDEPDAHADDEGERALLGAIAGLRKGGATVVLVSHRPSLMRHADRLALLRDGTLDLCGPRDEVLSRLAQGNVRRLRTADAAAGPGAKAGAPASPAANADAAASPVAKEVQA